MLPDMYNRHTISITIISNIFVNHRTHYVIMKHPMLRNASCEKIPSRLNAVLSSDFPKNVRSHLDNLPKGVYSPFLLLHQFETIFPNGQHGYQAPAQR